MQNNSVGLKRIPRNKNIFFYNVVYRLINSSTLLLLFLCGFEINNDSNSGWLVGETELDEVRYSLVCNGSWSV